MSNTTGTCIAIAIILSTLMVVNSWPEVTCISEKGKWIEGSWFQQTQDHCEFK